MEDWFGLVFRSLQAKANTIQPEHEHRSTATFGTAGGLTRRRRSKGGTPSACVHACNEMSLVSARALPLPSELHFSCFALWLSFSTTHLLIASSFTMPLQKQGASQTPFSSVLESLSS